MLQKPGRLGKNRKSKLVAVYHLRSTEQDNCANLLENYGWEGFAQAGFIKELTLLPDLFWAFVPGLRFGAYSWRRGYITERCPGNGR